MGLWPGSRNGTGEMVASTMMDDQEKKIVVEFCHLLEKSKQLFNGLRYVASVIRLLLKLVPLFWSLPDNCCVGGSKCLSRMIISIRK